MTQEQVWRELCKLDPALEPWQKCEHEWVHTKKHPVRCAKCDATVEKHGVRWLMMILRNGFPVFGDGDTSRYSTVDVLLGLCERLGIEVVRPAVCVFRGASDCRCEVEGSLASGKRGEGYAKGKQGEVVRVAVRAFSEAILRAFGRWSE